MLALGEYRGLLCPCGCGQLAVESQDPDNEFAYEVHVVRCHARTAISKESERRRDAPSPDALMFRAQLRE
ncbi:MAG: hypothetical protein ACRD0W_01105 [Acidimicrobiales bacterium]